ncbi:MAG: hypothetical protein KAS32_10230, partial [Candidatus Peribacteraceae bacterium]|nr:hypothetical protein [Candidatus Peribacteraceae bacterium]
VSSKTNSKVKFLKTVLISKVNSDECPKCKSQLKIKPLGTRTLYIDGHLEKCSKYSIYCSNCDGLFGTSGFKMIQFMKDFIRSPGSYLKSANVKAYENEVGIEFATNLSENHRCK